MKRAERGHDPGQGEHQLSPLASAYVGDWEHDCRETVNGDYNHDEPGGIEPKDSEYFEM